MPSPSPTARLAEATARIAARRKAAGESFLETMPDADDPLGVVGWVIRHQDAPRDVLAADAEDCLLIVHELQSVLRRRELSVLRLARKTAVSWQRIAAALGLQTRQAARQRMLRLEEEHAGGADALAIATARLGPAVGQEEWLDGHREAVLQAAKALIAAAPDGAPYLAEEADRLYPNLADVMLWMGDALHDYSPGMCPPAEALAAEWDALSR